MGEVYKGKHLLVGRPVAIKILRDKYSGNRSMIVRFFREAQAAAAIGHQHIIDIFDVGVTEQGDPFIVMEYLEGESLEDYLKRAGKISLGAACAILEPVLQALSAAHQKNIVHRDLKPANIFLTSDGSGMPVVKLIDFGVAKMPMAPESAQITQTGAMVGTPHYMAPEQIINADKIDTRTDIFTVGVILYELLTGSLPYDSDRPNAMMKEIVFGSPLPPSQNNADFPKSAEPIVMQAMERELDGRYASADAMLGDLRALDAWAERYTELAKLELEKTNTTVAMGTLGEEGLEEIDPDFAREHLMQMAQKSTPKRDDSDFNVLSADDNSGDSKSNSTWSSSTVTISFSPLPVVAAIVGFVALIVIGILFHFEIIGLNADPRQQEKAASLNTARKEQTRENVKVNIEGLPQGAKVLLNNEPIKGNPFEIKRTRARLPIAIEAPGYEPYVSHVVPKENLVIKVDLRPLQLPEKKTEAPQTEEEAGDEAREASELETAKKETKRKRKRSTSTQKPAKNALQRGSRGVEFIEDYN